MLNKTNKKHFRPMGFTLIELLVSIFIIALVSGLVLTNYGGSRRTSELRIAAQKVASDIRTIQTYSLSEKVNDKNNTMPAGGWGIYFSTDNNDRYVFFADNDNGRDYDTATENYSTIDLPKKIVIQSITLNGSGSTSGVVTFFPPDPITYINGSTSTILEITLKETTNNLTSKISVNPFGLIEVTN